MQLHSKSLIHPVPRIHTSSSSSAMALGTLLRVLHVLDSSVRLNSKKHEVKVQTM